MNGCREFRYRRQGGKKVRIEVAFATPRPSDNILLNVFLGRRTEHVDLQTLRPRDREQEMEGNADALLRRAAKFYALISNARDKMRGPETRDSRKSIR